MWYRSTVTDNHSIAGNLSRTSESGLVSAGRTDSGSDVAGMNAGGTESTSGDTFTFTQGETGSDNFSLAKTITGTLNGSGKPDTHPLESAYSDARRMSLAHRSELRARCIVAANAASHTRRSTTVNNPLRFVAGACTVGCW